MTKQKLCQKWDLNPRPHSWTRILDCCFTEQGLLDLESGALDHSAILTYPHTTSSDVSVNVTHVSVNVTHVCSYICIHVISKHNQVLY